jgi:hypothetical protein
MGTRVSRRTQDSLPMRRFLNRWFETLLDFPSGDSEAQARALSSFHRALARHRHGIAGAAEPWGWKNPRNMWLIPFYLSVFPELKFIHVVRDGRDMSLSGNRFLLRTHGACLLGREWKRDPERAQRTMWAMGNGRAADAARLCAPGHYFLLKYEELCRKPRETVAELYTFLGIPPDRAEDAAREIRPSQGIGRGASLARPAEDRAGEDFWNALERFGYC